MIKEKLSSTIEIAKGEPIKLVAKVAGEPQPKIQWVKDNVPIKESENVHLTQKPDGTVALEIDSAKESDSGKYELKATNVKGTTVSSSDVVIASKQIADSIIKQKLPSNIEIAEGKPLKLEAKVTGNPEVQWTKDGSPVKANENVKIDKKSDGTVSLEIEKAQPEDTGKYELKATTPKTQSVSSSDVVVGGKNFDYEL